jgi:hypothetical protein
MLKLFLHSKNPRPTIVKPPDFHFPHSVFSSTLSPRQQPRQLQTLDDLLAQTILQVKGVKVAQSGKSPRLPRSRR